MKYNEVNNRHKVEDVTIYITNTTDHYENGDDDREMQQERNMRNRTNNVRHTRICERTKEMSLPRRLSGSDAKYRKQVH